jgi:single-strand DNA-binding protein
MNSFQLRAVGNLAETPKLETKGDTAFAKIKLIGNDYAGKGKEEITTTVYFVAFGKIAETIAENCLKGDQLFLEAQVRANNWADEDSGEKRYGYSNIVENFKFGAPGKLKRYELASRE